MSRDLVGTDVSIGGWKDISQSHAAARYTKDPVESLRPATLHVYALPPSPCLVHADTNPIGTLGSHSSCSSSYMMCGCLQAASIRLEQRRREVGSSSTGNHCVACTVFKWKHPQAAENVVLYYWPLLCFLWVIVKPACKAYRSSIRTEMSFTLHAPGYQEKHSWIITSHSQVVVASGFSPGSFTGSNPGVSGLTVSGMTTPTATLRNSGC